MRAAALKDWPPTTREGGQKNEWSRPLAGRQENATRTVKDYAHWLQAFETSRGRKLRVLHIGNIANNGYLVAKFLRRIGVEADVLCYDYYHAMGTPEWEEIPIKHDYGDDYRPRFSREDIGDYERPRWFVSGPLGLSVGYLSALRENDQKRCESLWTSLEGVRLGYDLANVKTEGEDRSSASLWQRLRRIPRKAAAFAIMLPYWLARKLVRLFNRSLRAIGLRREADAFLRWAQRSLVAQIVISRLVAARARVDLESLDLARLDKLQRDFATLFPNRVDQLSLSDFAPYLKIGVPLERLFEKYDIIQGYATDPILPLICNKRPFVAFEHGTLRDFIREDNPLHRLTALAYRKADHVFITNGDCLEHARWLGCKNATAMLHPVDVEQHRKRDEAAVADLRRKYRGDVLLFCPIRHDWSVKGTDVHIRALPQIRKRVAGKVVLVLAPWGLQIEDSRRLVRSLACTRQSPGWRDRFVGANSFCICKRPMSC